MAKSIKQGLSAEDSDTINKINDWTSSLRATRKTLDAREADLRRVLARFVSAKKEVLESYVDPGLKIAAKVNKAKSGHLDDATSQAAVKVYESRADLQSQYSLQQFLEATKAAKARGSVAELLSSFRSSVDFKQLQELAQKAESAKDTVHLSAAQFAPPTWFANVDWNAELNYERLAGPPVDTSNRYEPLQPSDGLDLNAIADSLVGSQDVEEQDQ
jgi:hypothetical protein